ncbi:sodium/potassium/calcium exchanger 2-like [Tubulanus polymorphus]|uniref:sodium/potassium/calcium exchanger 2-like n=1 Tax=Tubulanus polymorphus TaxID=672921 RepID=UPI003DA54515
MATHRSKSDSTLPRGNKYSVVTMERYDQTVASVLSKRTRIFRLGILLGVFSIGYIYTILPKISTPPDGQTKRVEVLPYESPGHWPQRQLLASVTPSSVPSTTANITNVTAAPAKFKTLYPPELFTAHEILHGAILLYVLGILYMFVALAIVCDEFFVPSLNVIIERLNISEDVAGATFMAAGGSAPELFTSIMGLFIAHTDVGIGTIVGSAVFNILFVIGMCAMFSKDVLQLTWWPLFRDVVFYSIDLILLMVFFRDNKIEYWEALILLGMYALYVIFMVFNAAVEGWVKSLLPKTNQVQTVHSAENLILDERPQRTTSMPVLHSGSGRFRQGVLQLMIHTIDPLAEGRLHDKAAQLQAVVRMNSPREVNDNTGDNKLTTDSENNIANGGTQNNIANANTEKSQVYQNPNFRRDSQSGGGKEMNSDTEKSETNGPDAKSRPSTPHKLDTAPNKNCDTLTSISNGDLSAIQDKPESEMWSRHSSQPTTMTSLETVLDADESDETAATARNGKQKCNGQSVMSNGIGPPPPYPANGTSNAPENPDDDNKSTKEEMLEEEEEPLDLSWPKSHRKRFTYILLAPIIFLLWAVLPDVRRPEKRKYFPMTFLGSIMWIAVFTFMMTWWADTTGNAIGIPPQVMGVTFLAAGTSIPDLITSVIVAKKGFGDMAVSSSVGSNIFDITVGLPFPWLLACIIYWKPVSINSSGQICSVGLLFLMLMFVISSIAAFKWKMTKSLGGIMFVLYFIFLTITLLIMFDVLTCPV